MYLLLSSTMNKLRQCEIKQNLRIQKFYIIFSNSLTNIFKKLLNIKDKLNIYKLHIFSFYLLFLSNVMTWPSEKRCIKYKVKIVWNVWEAKG